MKVAILICSCDYYSDCWKPIIFSFNKYWSDCEYDKLIVSNHKDEHIQGVTIIKVGDHNGWASDTLKAVSLTDYDFYIYFQEDYFLAKKVDNYAIKKHIQHCVENNIEYLKLQPDRITYDSYRLGLSDYCKNPITKKYDVNTTVAIWRRSLFDKVCIHGNTGWDFEYKIVDYLKQNKISIQAEALHTSVVQTKGIVLIRANAIQRGKWTPAGQLFLKENGFENLLPKRKSQNKLYAWCYDYLPETLVLFYFKMAVLKFLRYFNFD